ncbi:50S ribosomal protein L34e [Thermocladium modestius]|nr:50S ribosomal protein L34e [Thermocladium modestius]
MARKIISVRKTPSGEVRRSKIKTGGGVAKCAVCGKPIKKSSRPFGGYICGNCLNTALKLSVLVSQ